MRAEVLDWIRKSGIKTFGLSTELPYDENRTPLYIKNPRKIYVSDPRVSREPFINVLGNRGIYSEITEIDIRFAADAKTPPALVQDTAARLETVRDIDTVGWFQSRESDVETVYENDLAVTTVTVRLTRLT